MKKIKNVDETLFEGIVFHKRYKPFLNIHLITNSVIFGFQFILKKSLNFLKE